MKATTIAQLRPSQWKAIRCPVSKQKQTSSISIDDHKAMTSKIDTPLPTRSTTARQMLMKLIAEESNTALLESNDHENTSDVKTTAHQSKLSLSAEGSIFYAQMNCDTITSIPGPSHLNNYQERLLSDFSTNKDIGYEDFDNSFSGLMLQQQRDLGDSTASDTDASHVRSSQYYIQSSIFESMSRVSTFQTNDTSDASNDTVEESISVEEIKSYIINSMPPDANIKISEEAWNRIFRNLVLSDGQDSSTTMPADTSQVEETPRSEENSQENVSMISDITESTYFIPPSTSGGPISTSAPQQWRDEQLLDTFEEESWNKGIFRPTAIKCTETIKAHNRRVHFSFVEVRHYQRILDINPAVTCGPAIGIGWQYRYGGTLSVQAWEKHRETRIRPKFDLVRTREERENLLTNLGYNQKEIAAAVRITRRAKDRRRRTILNVGTCAEAVEETLKSALISLRALLR